MACCCCSAAAPLSMLHAQARNLPPPPAKLPEKPEQYGVYRGQVANIIDLGCFVELAGFPSRQEGLVHLSNISKTRQGPVKRGGGSCMQGQLMLQGADARPVTYPTLVQRANDPERGCNAEGL